MGEDTPGGGKFMYGDGDEVVEWGVAGFDDVGGFQTCCPPSIPIPIRGYCPKCSPPFPRGANVDLEDPAAAALFSTN